jgi:predicted 3-demethylubiquinone-9 3-methyltransferase (glyoxalase superfamily)
MQKITPFLWFDDNAEEAVQFYTSIFKNSKTTGVMHYPEEGPGSPGTVMTITFQLDGQEFIALNGGPDYQFSPAISLFVNCETQEEMTSSGKNCLKAERPSNAAGSRTSTGFHGRSFRRL